MTGKIDKVQSLTNQNLFLSPKLPTPIVTEKNLRPIPKIWNYNESERMRKGCGKGCGKGGCGKSAGVFVEWLSRTTDVSDQWHLGLLTFFSTQRIWIFENCNTDVSKSFPGPTLHYKRVFLHITRFFLFRLKTTDSLDLTTPKERESFSF